MFRDLRRLWLYVSDRLRDRSDTSAFQFIGQIVYPAISFYGLWSSWDHGDPNDEAEKDRKMTIMLTTFMPCSAKLTVIALIVGTFFKGQSFSCSSGLFFRDHCCDRLGDLFEKNGFICWRSSALCDGVARLSSPRLDNIVRYVWLKSKGFVQKAGTIIFASNGRDCFYRISILD